MRVRETLDYLVLARRAFPRPDGHGTRLAVTGLLIFGVPLPTTWISGLEIWMQTTPFSHFLTHKSIRPYSTTFSIAPLYTPAVLTSPGVCVTGLTGPRWARKLAVYDSSKRGVIS